MRFQGKSITKNNKIDREDITIYYNKAGENAPLNVTILALILVIAITAIQLTRVIYCY